MYIKLTKFDNTPVWINAAFVVTVEPRRQNVGSVVVPIGDGLDYEVRESPEEVLAMLEGAPVPAVVPVPPPKSLTATPEDVSAEPMALTAGAVLAMADVEPEKDESKAAAKPAKKSVKKPAKAKKGVAVELSDEQVDRLRKLAPGSLRKLKNTISSQLKVADADSVVQALVKRGALSLENDHVRWN